MKKGIKIAAFIIIIAAFILYCNWETNSIEFSQEEFIINELPASFEGFKIAHLTDGHNKELSEEDVQKIIDIKPDIVVMTGDMADEHGYENALRLIERLSKHFPVYYSEGNHEQYIQNENYFLLAEHAGANILLDAKAIIEKNGEKIAIVGARDAEGRTASVLPGESSGYASLIGEETTILLHHRPITDMEKLEQTGAELVLCGHTHGGQVCLPIIGPILAPNQGIFPKYASGRFNSGEVQMYVSKGIGASAKLPLRFLCRPEITIITLKKK